MRSLKWLLMGLAFLGWIFTFETTDLRAIQTEQIEKDLLQKKKDLKKIKKDLSLTKEKETEIRGKESSVLESLYALETELYKKEKELKEMDPQLAQTRERLQQTKDQIIMLNRGMEQTKQEFFSRLNAFYKMGRGSPSLLLLASRSYLDLLRMDKYLRVVIDFDARLLETHRYQMVLKESYQKELIQDQSQLQRSIFEVEKKREEVKRVRAEKRALLKSIQNQKVVYQKVIGELEGRAKQLQALVDKLENEKNLLAYKGSIYDTVKGKLISPVQGKVISLFKEKGQNGIEIQAPMGAEIRAVLSGKVLYADWFKGFGNMVIIDHGDHTCTVSAYCSHQLKKEGDVVSQGETIARVGSAGSLKGPCLYFEIRHRGKPQDPMDWISHPEKTISLQEEDKKGRK
jgi:septal ring factor EnvC (AmiA/AmiB activator)